MARGLVVGDLRVQVLERAGRAAVVHDRVARGRGPRGGRCVLAHPRRVGHPADLRLLAGGPPAMAGTRGADPGPGHGLHDLQRYMGLVGAKVAGPHGEPWRAGKHPYGRSALRTAAACLKGFYVHQASVGVNRELGDQLAVTRLPTKATGGARCWGTWAGTAGETRWPRLAARRRHPKMLPDGARDKLLAGGFHGAGPDGDHLAERWRVQGRRTVRAAPRRPAPAGGRGCGECRARRTCTCATGRAIQPGGGQDKTGMGRSRAARSAAG